MASSTITACTGELVGQQLASSAISGIVESHTVVDQPQNGRDWTLLETLQRGVAQVRTPMALAIRNQRANPGLATHVTIDPNRLQQNTIRLDGVSTKQRLGPGNLLHRTFRRGV